MYFEVLNAMDDKLISGSNYLAEMTDTLKMMSVDKRQYIETVDD